MILAEPMTSESQLNTCEDRINDTSRVNEKNIWMRALQKYELTYQITAFIVRKSLMQTFPEECQ